jgi:hypothetical protein
LATLFLQIIKKRPEKEDEVISDLIANKLKIEDLENGVLSISEKTERVVYGIIGKARTTKVGRDSFVWAIKS